MSQKSKYTIVIDGLSRCAGLWQRPIGLAPAAVAASRHRHRTSRHLPHTRQLPAPGVTNPCLLFLPPAACSYTRSRDIKYEAER